MVKGCRGKVSVMVKGYRGRVSVMVSSKILDNLKVSLNEALSGLDRLWPCLYGIFLVGSTEVGRAHHACGWPQFMDGALTERKQGKHYKHTLAHHSLLPVDVT